MRYWGLIARYSNSKGQWLILGIDIGTTKVAAVIIERGRKIPAWDAIISNFSPVFTQPAARIFVNLVTGWVLCTCRRTITGILPFAEPKGKRPHDALAALRRVLWRKRITAMFGNHTVPARIIEFFIEAVATAA